MIEFWLHAMIHRGSIECTVKYVLFWNPSVLLKFVGLPSTVPETKRIPIRSGLVFEMASDWL